MTKKDVSKGSCAYKVLLQRLFSFYGIITYYHMELLLYGIRHTNLSELSIQWQKRARSSQIAATAIKPIIPIYDHRSD